MEPIPKTVEALRELTRFGDDTTARHLLDISRAVEAVAPDVVGLSLSSVDDGLTFTVTATTGPVAELDAVQYLDDGPCEEAVRTGRPHGFLRGDTVDEERWRLFARATAAAGVESTLSMPIVLHGAVVAGVNMYGSHVDTFDGHHDALAAACGAWAGGAVENADLDFTTRFRAGETPDRIRAGHLFDQAVGTLMSRLGFSLGEAEDRLCSSALRAGISDTQMARAILDLFYGTTPEDEPDDPA